MKIEYSKSMYVQLDKKEQLGDIENLMDCYTRPDSQDALAVDTYHLDDAEVRNPLLKITGLTEPQLDGVTIIVFWV